MSGLSEQIAVLDGITIAPGDGNYGGGASYPDSGRWPLLPSGAGLNGLAAHNDLQAAANQVYQRREGMPDLPNVAPRKRAFASFSGGANRSGGSTYPDGGGFPTWAQAGAGLAAAGYPNDLPNVAPRKRAFASFSGGANRSGGSTYPDGGGFPTWAQAGAGLALGTMPNNLPNARALVSASGSSNYSGGSTYPDSGRFPLTGSYTGLACSCGVEGLGAMRRMPAMTRDQIMSRIQLHAQNMVNARQALTKVLPMAQRAQLLRAYTRNLAALTVLRSAAGLPTLPESQQLVARLKTLQNRRTH